MTEEGFVGFDRAGVVELARRTGAAIRFCDGISSDEPFATGALAALRSIGHRFSTRWLPHLATLAGDRTLLDWPPADAALAAIADGVGALDADGDGALSWAEVAAGAGHPDASLAAACRFMVDRPLAFVNTALAEANYSIGDVDDLSIDNIEDGGWEFDMDGDLALWQSMALTPATIASAMAQHRHQRTLARPDVFATADGIDDGGAIDGRVSLDDLRALAEHSDDAEVVAMCAYFLEHADAFTRIDRESPDTGFDGTIAYDQLYALGHRQGGLIGLPDPAVPASLHVLYGEPVDHGDRVTQFLHELIEPQPGQGQVVIALYVPTTAHGGRGPDAAAHPSESMLHVVVDYETGIVTVRIPPSVGRNGGVADALPIVTDTGAGGMWFGRLTPADDSNHVGIAVDEHGAIDLSVAILDAGTRAVAPWVNGRFVISPADGGQVRLFWSRDQFPAMEAYHIYPDGRIVTLADDDAALGTVIGALGDAGVSAGVDVG